MKKVIKKMNKDRLESIRARILAECTVDYTFTAELLEAYETLQYAYEAVDNHLRRHLEENHGCENCPHKTGWCELPNVKEECARLILADRDKFKSLVESRERALKGYDPCESCENIYGSAITEPCLSCQNDGETYSNWRFDEARFSQEEPTDDQSKT